MSSLIKYRVHEVAKDFNLGTKEITDILTKYAKTPKNHMQVLEDGELAILFDYLTQHHPVDSIESIYADVYREPKPAPAPKAETKEEKPKQQPQPAAEQKAEEPEELIDIDTFAKVKLKVAKVVAAEAVKKSNKLLKLTVKCGEETRTVVSGISTHYSPEEMVGKTVILVANLKPAKLKGIVSEGMLLAAADDEKGTLRLLTVDGDIEDGAEVG